MQSSKMKVKGVQLAASSSMQSSKMKVKGVQLAASFKDED
jgi:hypothetical protein